MTKTFLYLNEDKKRTRNGFQVCGISVPLNGTKFGFIRSVTYQDGKSQVENTVHDSSFITSDDKNDRAEFSWEMDPVEALEEQVKLLRKQEEYWKSQTKRTDGKKADSKAVRKLVLQPISNKKSGNRKSGPHNFGRSGGIRTRGLMDPNHARYQTSPHPDSADIIMNYRRFVKGKCPILSREYFFAIPFIPFYEVI